MSYAKQYDRQSISVDCVLFGYDADANSLRVALIKRGAMGGTLRQKKLPGSLIDRWESIEDASRRVIEELTGVDRVEMKQMAVFSSPNRVSGEELEWVKNFYNTSTDRVLTVAFYTYIKLSPRIVRYTVRKGVEWVDVDSVKQLALDHREILMVALETLVKRFVEEPIAFDLLPTKFTILQLRQLYATIINEDIDPRNFRKKLLSSGYINPTGEFEKGVAHKPAEYFTFNRRKYERGTKRKQRQNLINWQL